MKHSLYSDKDDAEDLKKGLIKHDPNAPTPEEIMKVDQMLKREKTHY